MIIINIHDLIDINYDFIIKGITDDSRKVKEGYIFVATKGFNVDHYDYIDDAIKKGCVFLVVDREIKINFPHIVVDNINNYYKMLCIKFNNINLDKFHFIGITGTDGKTTTTTIIKEIVDDTALIGTNGVSFLDKVYPTNNTTPCVEEFYKDLKLISEGKIFNISMEVSSEALLHERVSNIKFDIVGITNITGDHLNVHGSFNNYLESKLKILDLVKKEGIILVNGDDPLLRNLKKDNLYTFGFLENNDFYIKKVKYFKRSTEIILKYYDRLITIVSPLIGKYNVYNVVLAFLVGIFKGMDETLLLKRIKSLKQVSGRCEFLDFKQDFDIVLDYAHTINGIENILDTFKDYKEIITVTGCAGGRDKTKRRSIGKIVMEKSDISIFTMDDPRFEDVNDIIDDMVGSESNYIRIVDRREAIYKALSLATKGSVVLILGKGRDNYMAIQDKKEEYSDYVVVKEYFDIHL